MCIIKSAIQQDNLVSNALKFTEEGKIVINIEAGEKHDEQQEFYISVEDTGIGIPEDKLDYILDTFGQAEESTTRRFGGTGLGLSICKKLVKEMNGQIGVESTLGHGSKFWFTIQLPLSSLKDIENNQQHQDTEVTASTLFQKVHILLAEDNPTNLMIVTEMLEQSGCKVTPAGNGIEAVEREEKQKFDLTLMDCQMPEMDGYEATRAIRKREKDNQLSATPIIALTANAMKGDSEKCLDAGMDHYISKPVKKDTLATAIGKWLPEEKKKVA